METVDRNCYVSDYTTEDEEEKEEETVSLSDEEDSSAMDIYEVRVNNVLEGTDRSSDEEDEEEYSDHSSSERSIDDLLDAVGTETFSGDATLGRVFSLRREQHVNMEVDTAANKTAQVAASRREQVAVYHNYTVYESLKTTSITL